MDSLELDDDAFYICTEVSPRCFIVQKAIQIDRNQIERMVGDIEKAAPNHIDVPPPPVLPYWFTPDCRNNLVNCELPATSVPAAPSPVPQQPVPDLKQQLKAQLEYYFSRENLVTDRYLRCQMDTDQYVPISIIAGFRKIVQLTNDYNLILQVLRESNQVEVDERGEKVRPVCRRCTIILREISEDRQEDVEKMLEGGPPYVDLKYGLNNSWYVMYANEETTQSAYLHLQSLDLDKPICARIKAGGPPAAELPTVERLPAPSFSQMPADALEAAAVFTPLMELGHLLASYGYVPRAVFRPGATVVHVEEEMNSRPPHREYPQRHSPRGGRSYNNNNNNNNNTNGFYNGGERRYRGDGGGRGRGGVTRRGDRDRDGNRDKFHGNRRNGGAPNGDFRRRSDYWNNSVSPVPALSVSTGDLTSSSQLPERPRYNSFRKPQEGEECVPDLLTVKGRRWEPDADIEDDNANERKTSSQSASSVYSFEEKAFPSLGGEPKPEPEKPVEKPSFSCVAAGKRYAKPEPRKSYAEKLKERR